MYVCSCIVSVFLGKIGLSYVKIWLSNYARLRKIYARSRKLITQGVYCPWDVVYYCKDHQNNPNAEIKNYWINTSGNEVIQHFVDSMNDPHMLTKSELKLLMSGDTVVKEVDEMITHKELYSSMDNLWSALFMTGCLTQRGKEPDGRYHLAIPNRGIRDCMVCRIKAVTQLTNN